MREIAGKFHKNLCAGPCCFSELPVQAQGEYCIVGTLESIEFKRLVEDINYSLVFDHPYEADLSEQEKLARIDFYWEEVGKYFYQPPTRVYKFNDYNPFGIIWGLEYIYINDKNKTGIVLSGGSAD